MWYAAEICWSDELKRNFSLADHSRERTISGDRKITTNEQKKQKIDVGLHVDIYRPITLKLTWYDDRHYCTLQFDTSLNDFDLYSRSQLFQNEKSLSLIFFQV